MPKGRYGSSSRERWLGLAAEGVRDVARIYVLVVPLFLVAFWWTAGVPLMRLPMATQFDELPGHCPDCGAAVKDGRMGCKRLFEETLARQFEDYRYAAEHRLIVDAYCLQHPDEYMRSAKSYAAHLTGAYIAISHGAVAETHRVVQQWLNGSRALHRPHQPDPGERGTLTILHVHMATDPQDHVRRVREWATSVWAAWWLYHPIARQWTDEALGRGRPV